ncbi:T9SS type A sorting domain-containing protein [Luteibaculum oceani]|uniref:T9SS type A sorting domain-containing protein n=1 Tax=Luteibaculum oceani TaxID=1294296 RepID=A0A5C6VIB2_9FLAO|nr:T9SS type A sorting domain-containing protein [Luteibaculum oceani]TXC85063.1 T9SS type A sorting domain-containing protein [Luteibaculum oceani]
MKRLLLLLLASVFTGGLFAQTVIYTETFANGAPDWTIENLGNSPEQFQIVTLNNTSLFTSGADGSLYANGYNTGAGTTHQGHTTITSPGFDCSSYDKVMMTFEQLFSHIQSNSTCKVLASNDSTTWTTVYSNTGEITDPILTYVDLTAVAANQPKVYLKFEFTSTGDRYWIVDDVTVFNPVAINLNTNYSDIVRTLGGIKVITYSPAFGRYGMRINVQNTGGDVITDIEVDYDVNGGTTESYSFTGLNIAPAESDDIIIPNIVQPSGASFFRVTANIKSVNGVSYSADTQMADAIFYKDGESSPRTPVIEVFTSSTCGPCLPGNTQIHSVMDPKDPKEYVMIKYQQDFPGTGDPYCTDEAVSRRGFYGVNSIPNTAIDGGWNQNPNGGAFNNTVYNDHKDIPSVVVVSGTYNVDPATKTVTYSVDVTPDFDIPAGALNVNIQIIEGKTDNNVKSNGETEFHQVMKKMLTGVLGQPLPDLKAGVATNISGSYTFQGNYRLPNNAGDRIDHEIEHTVEEFEDLYVVAFVQHMGSKKIIGGGNTSKSTSIEEKESVVAELTASPNPFNNVLNLNIDAIRNASANVVVMDVTGKVVASELVEVNAGSQEVSLDLSNVNAGVYTVAVNVNGSAKQVKVVKL